ncbi:MAG: bifunctional phosphoribosylaminoimidazolecarboxamide formyltransferase/IMP cyclohydrolase [candidate division WOR-3 bacterium]
MKPKRALISVWDKTGIVEFTKELVTLGIEILATGKTAQILKDSGIKVLEVSEWTKSPELLNGRVKTIHPKIAAGILSYRKESNIEPIDIVVCNLYPFEHYLKENLAVSDMVELIDIGGVTLLRAAVKNYAFVTAVPKPEFYPLVLKELKEFGEVSSSTRELLALKTLEIVAHYDSVIYEYFYRRWQQVDFPEFLTKSYIKSLPLRYGENPHQKGFFYADPFSNIKINQLWGKELSYNNLLDIDSVIGIISEFAETVCAIIKHNTPCGVALGINATDAFRRAFACDPKSAFGGIVGCNQPIEVETAKAIVESFFEVIVSPKVSEEALTVFKTKKNLRVVEFSGQLPKLILRSALGGILIQERDSTIEDSSNWQLVSESRPTQKQLKDLEFAWRVVKFVRSNGIVLAKDLRTVGIGAGQMSRVDSVELAIKKAEDLVKGSVMASDGFFPFRDSIDIAHNAGVGAIVEPGGSVRDAEVIQACNEYKLPLLFTQIRHFRH